MKLTENISWLLIYPVLFQAWFLPQKHLMNHIQDLCGTMTWTQISRQKRNSFFSIINHRMLWTIGRGQQQGPLNIFKGKTFFILVFSHELTGEKLRIGIYLNKCSHRISANSFRGNYSFLDCDHYSREEITFCTQFFFPPLNHGHKYYCKVHIFCGLF